MLLLVLLLPSLELLLLDLLPLLLVLTLAALLLLLLLLLPLLLLAASAPLYLQPDLFHPKHGICSPR